MKLADDLHNLLAKDKQSNGNGTFSNDRIGRRVSSILVIKVKKYMSNINLILCMLSFTTLLVLKDHNSMQNLSPQHELIVFFQQMCNIQIFKFEFACILFVNRLAVRIVF